MSIWVVIVALLSIAATLGLASVLYRINAPQDARRRQDASGGDGGASYTPADGGGRSNQHDHSDAGDGGGDGGDGGGGGGD